MCLHHLNNFWLSGGGGVNPPDPPCPSMLKCMDFGKYYDFVKICQFQGKSHQFGHILTDSNGLFEHFNRSICKLTHFREPKVVGDVIIT